MQEFSQMLQNIVRIDDDWCHDHLLHSLKIMPVLLYLCNNDQFGVETVLAALDCIECIISYNEGFEQKLEQTKDLVLESTDPFSGSSGLEVLESLTLHENEHIRDQVQDILEEKFDHYISETF